MRLLKNTRYRGEFLSRAGVVWRVDIWQYLPQGQSFASIGELTFPAGEPVVIEWDERGKEEVVCGSSATVTIESPGDRTYAGLYTEAAGEIGVDIYKDGSIYWVGTLDPEQYEEPYERASCYDVTLCFQDFGILDRLRYTLEGMQTMGEVLRSALALARLGSLFLDLRDLIPLGRKGHGGHDERSVVEFLRRGRRGEHAARGSGGNAAPTGTADGAAQRKDLAV